MLMYWPLFVTLKRIIKVFRFLIQKQAQARRWDVNFSHNFSDSTQSSVLSAWFAPCSFNRRQYTNTREVICTYSNWFRYYDIKLLFRHFISCIFTRLTGGPFAGTRNRMWAWKWFWNVPNDRRLISQCWV